MKSDSYIACDIPLHSPHVQTSSSAIYFEALLAGDLVTFPHDRFRLPPARNDWKNHCHVS